MASEGGSPATETDRGPRLVEQVLDLSLVAVLWFMTRTTFSEGYFRALGLLPELALSPPLEASVAVGVFTLVSGAALLFMRGATVAVFGERSASRSFLSRTVAATSL